MLDPKPFHYTLFGLVLHSNHAIPNLTASESRSKPQVELTLGAIPPPLRALTESPAEVCYVSPSSTGTPNLRVSKFADGQYFHFLYCDGAEFLVDCRGAAIWASWPRDTLTLEDTVVYLLGPIMGFVLLLRGSISLHASAITVDHKAIALVGPAGSGKSTTAAAFADLGYGVLAEDVVTLEDCEATFKVQPAYPCIRLWPPSVAALYGPQAQLPRLTPTWDKCYLDVSQAPYEFQKEPVPLAAIYLLRERSDNPGTPLIEDIKPADALLSLVSNTYTNYLMDKVMHARGFELLGRVVGSVALRQVTPHANAAYLGRLCDAIIEDFNNRERLMPVGGRELSE